MTARAAGRQRAGAHCVAGGVSSGMHYLLDGRLLMSRSDGTATGGRTNIALLRPEDGGATGVERTLVDDPAYNLESPSVSPDGRRIAFDRAGAIWVSASRCACAGGPAGSRCGSP